MVVDSEAAVAAPGLLLSLGTAAAFRLRVVGAVVVGGSAVSIAEEAFECEVAAAAGTPDGREAWATWRAVDRVILGDMSVNLRVQTAGRVVCREDGLNREGQAASGCRRNKANGAGSLAEAVVQMEMCRSLTACEACEAVVAKPVPKIGKVQEQVATAVR